jgi:hypothetical protein
MPGKELELETSQGHKDPEIYLKQGKNIFKLKVGKTTYSKININPCRQHSPNSDKSNSETVWAAQPLRGCSWSAYWGSSPACRPISGTILPPSASCLWGF